MHRWQSYIEKTPKESIRETLELINEFSEVVGYKISTQKPAVFLCNSSEQSKKEIKKAITEGALGRGEGPAAMAPTVPASPSPPWTAT